MNPAPKADLILRKLYQLGGSGTTKQIFELITPEEIERFNIEKSWIVKYINHMKHFYLTTKYKKKYWGNGGQTYILNPRVIKYYQEKGQNELVDTSIPSETPD